MMNLFGGRSGLGCSGLLLPSALTGFLAFVFLAIGGFFGYTSMRLIQEGVRTDGVVVELIEQYDSEDSSYSYLPVFQFRLNGDSHTSRGFVATSPPAYEIGEHVEIFVDPNNPDRVRADRFVDLWLFPVVFGGVGVILFVITIIISVSALNPLRV